MERFFFLISDRLFILCCIAETAGIHVFHFSVGLFIKFEEALTKIRIQPIILSARERGKAIIKNDNLKRR